MSQLNETWASLTQDERDEMNEKDRKGRIKSLAMKYGRRRVDAAKKEVESDAKRTGRNTKKRPITWRELQSRIENTKNTLKPGEVRRWDKEKGKWVSNKEDVDEGASIALRVGSKIPWRELITGIGAAGTYFQSRKKKEKEEDLLGAVRKKQAEIQQDVANKETLKKNEKLINQDKQKGEHVIRKKAPENEFAGDVINNQGPGIKPGSGTKKGGVWDKLPKGKQSNWNKGNTIQGIAKEVKKQQSKAKLKKLLRDKYGNKDQLTGRTLPEEMMGGGAIANNVGDGKIAGTVEAGDDPPVKKKKRYIYGGKGSRKMWMKNGI